MSNHEPRQDVLGNYRWYCEGTEEIDGKHILPANTFALLTDGEKGEPINERWKAKWREYPTYSAAIMDYTRAALGIVRRTPDAATQLSLVWLTGEDFPRLRTNGRLIWLGEKWNYPHYHDPELGGEMINGVWITDPTQFALSLPDGVKIEKQLHV